ncbi:hypothetical protein [Corallococcus terminator]|uniref:Uncharacterized protein n=1 Tax=Corallococcus terminator TaxID=2316733 RepID=A0A3A8IY75_9BACT|nr:hypothetical protein [Corallococcus terminator]RKG88417.1 hypothetical protein D7V88_14365 [Corallococcus terminator]
MTQEKKGEKVQLQPVGKPPKPIPPDSGAGAEPLRDDDLLIVDEQGGFCRVQRTTYLQHEINANSPELKRMISQMRFLTGLGVVLADLPSGSLTDVDCACYLVNLAGIRGPESPSKNEREHPT